MHRQDEHDNAALSGIHMFILGHLGGVPTNVIANFLQPLL